MSEFAKIAHRIDWQLLANQREWLTGLTPVTPESEGLLNLLYELEAAATRDGITTTLTTPNGA